MANKQSDSLVQRAWSVHGTQDCEQYVIRLGYQSVAEQVVAGANKS